MREEQNRDFTSCKKDDWRIEDVTVMCVEEGKTGLCTEGGDKRGNNEQETDGVKEKVKTLEWENMKAKCGTTLGNVEVISLHVSLWMCGN